MRQSRLKNYVIIYKGNDRFLYGRIYGDFRFPEEYVDTKYISFILSPLGVYAENKEKNA